MFLGGYNQTEAVIIYGINYPDYIRRSGQPDLIVGPITKEVGLIRADTGGEITPGQWNYFTPYQTSLNVLDRVSQLTCRTTGNGSCGLYIYGAAGGGAQDDMKRESIISSNPGVVTCHRGGCGIQGPGTATVTINYVYEWGIVSRVNTNNRNVAENNRLFRFSMPSVTYYINVVRPNSVPTVSYTNTTNISYNTATSNWSYSDPDGDAQTWSAVQVATDSGFSNIVLTQYGNSSATNMALSGLQNGTTYYPRVAVYNNVNGWSGWSNGPAFTTVRNNPPNLGEFSCSGTPTGYTSARVNWNYTGNDPDQLELSLKYIRSGDSVWTSVNLPANRTGSQNIASLIPGDTYAVRIEVLDQYNTNLRGNISRWQDCGNVTATPYPQPQVDFSLVGGGNTVIPGGTLTVNTGDSIGVNWNITNTDGVDSSTCRITTSGVQQIFNINPLGSFSGGTSNTPAANPNDQNYTVRLQCAGRTPANPVRNIDQTINVTIRTRPVISCTVNNNVVSAENPTVDIVGNVSNATGPYSWGIRRQGSGAYTPLGDTGNSINTTLDYAGLAFGKYQPWLQVSANGRTSETACAGIANLGDRNIREIAP